MTEKLDENFIKSLVVIALGIMKGKGDPYDLVNGAMEYLISNKEKYMDHPNIKAIAVLKMKGLFIDGIRKNQKMTSMTDDEGNDLSLPKLEQIPRDYFKKGESVRAVIKEVSLKNNKANIVLSRIAPEFIERLFEQEVPEVFDGIITIKNVVRIPGERAKVAVESYDDRIDPVGACVGMKGSRIHSIVRELKNENIDVVNFTENSQLLITRALNPAKITSVKLDDEKMRASVFMAADQVSLAIGRGGHNINLAGKLSGYDIDVYRDAGSFEDDVAIDEFTDELEAWVIDALKAIGCDTAKSVLDISAKDLVLRTDLEIETVESILSVLSSEFED